jgi:hypothetical protein
MGTRSSKNNTNNGEDEEQPQPQLRRSARKRKLNELANDGKPEGGEDQIQQEEGSSKMNRKEKNDQDLEVCNLQLHIGLYRKRKTIGSNSPKNQ